MEVRRTAHKVANTGYTQLQFLLFPFSAVAVPFLSQLVSIPASSEYLPFEKTVQRVGPADAPVGRRAFCKRDCSLSTLVRL